MLTNLQAVRMEAIANGVWAMRPDRFHALLASSTSKPDAIAERELEIKDAKAVTSRVSGSIAVIPIRGILAQHPEDWYGDTSYEAISAMIDSVSESSSISGIILDIDSPGGIVYGVQESYARIKEASANKSIIAVINSEAASAAYYLASACSEIVMSPGSQAGSIGTVCVHMDISKALDDAGVKVTYIHAGQYKVEGNMAEPLGDEARAELQRTVDDYYAMFVGAVASGRGVSEKADFGQGRMFRANAAMEAGLADRVATLDQVAEQMTGRRRGSAAARAAQLRKREVELRAMGL